MYLYASNYKLINLSLKKVYIYIYLQEQKSRQETGETISDTKVSLLEKKKFHGMKTGNHQEVKKAS